MTEAREGRQQISEKYVSICDSVHFSSPSMSFQPSVGSPFAIITFSNLQATSSHEPLIRRNSSATFFPLHLLHSWGRATGHSSSDSLLFGNPSAQNSLLFLGYAKVYNQQGDVEVVPEVIAVQAYTVPRGCLQIHNRLSEWQNQIPGSQLPLPPQCLHVTKHFL